MHFETYIKQIIQRTPEVKSFRFHKPAGMDCSAGQYMMVTIKSEGMELRKPVTISSSPTEQDFLEFTKKLTQHPFSKALDALKTGDKVQIEAPFGNFIFKGEYDKIAMLACGIGITPLGCMIKYATDKKLKTNIMEWKANAQEKIMEVYKMAEPPHKIALMCAEKHWNSCHRDYFAGAALCDLGKPVVNLGIR